MGARLSNGLLFRCLVAPKQWQKWARFYYRRCFGACTYVVVSDEDGDVEDVLFRVVVEVGDEE